MPSDLVRGLEAVFPDKRLRSSRGSCFVLGVQAGFWRRRSRVSHTIEADRSSIPSNAFVIWLVGWSRTIAYNEVETRNLSSAVNFTIHSDRGLRLRAGRGLAISNEEQSNV